MNERRMALKGALAQKRDERLELAARAARLIKELENTVMPLSAVRLEDMRTDHMLAAARDLHETKEAYLTVCAGIREIEAELE